MGEILCLGHLESLIKTLMVDHMVPFSCSYLRSRRRLNILVLGEGFLATHMHSTEFDNMVYYFVLHLQGICIYLRK